MFDIQALTSYIAQSGTLPSNRFEVIIPLPPILRNGIISKEGVVLDLNSLSKTDLTLRAESVRAPGITINTSQVNRYGIGPIQKFPNNGNFTDTSMTFLCDRNSYIWVFWYQWLNSVFVFDENDRNLYSQGNDYSTYRSNYKDDYATDIEIDVYNYDVGPGSGIVSNRIKLIDAFPVSVNDVNLDWGQNNTNLKITVTLAFSNWTIVNTNRNNYTRESKPMTSFIPTRAQTVQSIALPTAFTADENQLGEFNSMSTKEKKGVGTVMGVQQTGGSG